MTTQGPDFSSHQWGIVAPKRPLPLTQSYLTFTSCDVDGLLRCRRDGDADEIGFAAPAISGLPPGAKRSTVRSPTRFVGCVPTGNKDGVTRRFLAKIIIRRLRWTPQKRTSTKGLSARKERCIERCLGPAQTSTEGRRRPSTGWPGIV